MTKRVSGGGRMVRVPADRRAAFGQWRIDGSTDRMGGLRGPGANKARYLLYSRIFSRSGDIKA
ncbi:hypothetical protein [Alicyclobacillus acidoterrestris]|uniref:Uncharacterized protein n=1 Tax=Alicyclobacillus acidoterrestris (strain ATCC 49025 / DSM 3922 / CIP 106132 / NCIMB 13137 / GD3B) TaxID=1356854 RepID=A0A9E6ZHN9_ALIAG|nr:hypothetical protein [Alicyclobacillus acidoterrestris]UNO50982.1 hypothetical protein K1I37_09265 [Alicyclobacillus acidoterrestris]